MTRKTTFFKLSAFSLLSLTACQTAPQNGVVKTDLGGSMSQMWANILTGELRPAPEAGYSFGPHYAFGATDATLNTAILMNRLALQDRASVREQALYVPQYRAPASAPLHPLQRRESFTNPMVSKASAKPVMTPKLETPRARIKTRRSFGSRIKSIFSSSETDNETPLSSYETFETQKRGTEQHVTPQSVKQPAALTRPAKSQPVIETPMPRAEYDIPPRASIDDNLKAMGRRTAPIEPIASTKPHANWQAANQEIGDSLSYVKMGGGSKISDWQACETQAGQYFQATASGFIVDPAFDLCMRASGYKPEAEAQRDLEISAN